MLSTCVFVVGKLSFACGKLCAFINKPVLVSFGWVKNAGFSKNITTFYPSFTHISGSFINLLVGAFYTLYTPFITKEATYKLLNRSY